ncbi:MAG: hypothetical protein J6332_06165, partial [Abditibacteriota bacterium]|nr:hypothetical protein [Abditibacteriota bacterium]
MDPILPGVHTIRIIKDSRVAEQKDVLKGITVHCKADTMKATQPKALLMEVIGDSSTQGSGSVVTDTPDTTKHSISVALSYAYLVPDALDMDWEMCVRGSLGLITRTGDPPYNYQEMYEYQNRWRDPATKYTFPR